MAFHPSTCPFCSCGCGVLLHEENGTLLSGFPSVGHGGRAALCIRGWNCTGSVSHPDRLVSPMVRRADGLARVSVQEAVEAVASRLRDASFPPLFAVGPSLANEDVYAVRRLAGVLGARLAATDLSGVQAARFALEQVCGRGYGLQDLEALASADLIWIVGADSDECPQVTSRVVDARRRGVEIVQFDIHLAVGEGPMTVTVPPDEFGLLPLLLQRAVFDGDLAVDAARRASGFDALAAYWRSAPPLAECSWMTREAAVSVARQLAAATRPVIVIGGRWLTSAGAEAHTVRLLQALVLAGAAERVLVPVGEANSWGSLDILGPGIVPAELACCDEGIDTLIVVGDDLVGRSPQPEALGAALRRLRTVVVVDRYSTGTLPFADLVLPSCMFAETDGTTTSALGVVHRWRRVVDPPGECASERVWASRIGRRAGHEDWPETPLEWFDSCRRETDGYRDLSPDVLYPGGSSGRGDAAADGEATRVAVRTHLSFDAPEALPEPPGGQPDAAYPLRLVLGLHAASWATGAVSLRDELLRRELAGSTVAASPALLEGLGIKPGSTARLVVPSGQADVLVRADRRVPGGALVLVPLAGSPAMALRGREAGPERRSVGMQPIPARLERG